MIQTIKAYEHIRNNLQKKGNNEIILVSEAIRAVEIAEEEIGVVTDRIQEVKGKARRNAIEAHKYTCPSRNNKGCRAYKHIGSKCDGNCNRIKLFNNLLDRTEL